MKNLNDLTWEAKMKSVQEHLRGWRRAHPRATLRQIEEEVEKCLAQMRVVMVGELALSSEATDGREAGERMRCPECAGKLVKHGERERRLQDEHDQEVILKRAYFTCSQCGRGFFPSGPAT